ncbi:MAG: mechanosensitive ion channel domain-containing protein [Woeseiaceae bacterium]
MGKADFVERVGSNPELAAIAVLVIGLIAARLLSLAVGYALSALDRRIARMTTSASSLLTPRLIKLSRAIVFWIVLIMAVAMSLRILGASGTADGLNSALSSYVPDALIVFSIVAVGHLLGVLCSHLVAELREDLTPESPGPRLVYGAVLGVSVVMALQHIGMNLTFLTRILLIAVAVGGGGLMLAFALGASRHVANLLAHREVGRLAVGERIRIDDLEGIVVEVHSTAVDIATKDGIASIPASRFAEVSVLRIEHGDSDE